MQNVSANRPIRVDVWRWCLLLIASSGLTTGLSAAEPARIQPNGGWCWFQRERAVMLGERVIFTTIAGEDRDGFSGGDLVVTSYDFSNGRRLHFILHPQLGKDDHNVASLTVLPDQRLLAVYGRHGQDHLQRWRITEEAGNVERWSPEKTLDVGAGYTYSNVFSVDDEGTYYNFHRGVGFNPNCTISKDHGRTWQNGWRLVHRSRADYTNDPRFTGLDGGRPYVCYASNNRGEIHFAMTDDHPRAYDNSIYHGFIRGQQVFKSNKTPLADGKDQLLHPRSPQDFTEVFHGSADQVAWINDIRMDREGRPYLGFSVQVNSGDVRTKQGQGGSDHRYYQARWDGAKWTCHEIAYAGTKLYAGEDDYTGLVALHPYDPDLVVISTNVDPLSGQPLVGLQDGNRHWELYRGSTKDDGVTWQWQPLTSSSALDNLRPLVVVGSSGEGHVLFTQGTLRSYMDYSLDVMTLPL